MEIKTMSMSTQVENPNETAIEKPEILEEIIVEELSIDGICGVY